MLWERHGILPDSQSRVSYGRAGSVTTTAHPRPVCSFLHPITLLIHSLLPLGVRIYDVNHFLGPPSVVPEVVLFSDALEAPLSTGEDAALTCRASRGDTPMTISWTFGGQPVADDLGVRVISAGSRTSFLTIESVEAAHSGKYTCTATNAVGKASGSARLTVKG